jgi:tetratricopeptide (TPR) repeat protein
VRVSRAKATGRLQHMLKAHRGCHQSSTTVASGSASRCSRHSPASPSLSTVAGASAVTPAVASACLNASAAIAGLLRESEAGPAALSADYLASDHLKMPLVLQRKSDGASRRLGCRCRRDSHRSGQRDRYQNDRGSASGQGRLEEPIAKFEYGVRLHPNDFGAYRMLGFSKLAIGLSDEAIPLLTKSIRLDSLSAYNCYSHTRIGLALGGHETDCIEWQQSALAGGGHCSPAWRAQ